MDEQRLTMIEETARDIQRRGAPVLFAELPDAVIELVAEHRALIVELQKARTTIFEFSRLSRSEIQFDQDFIGGRN
jgi:hypothetical protein